MNILRQLIIAAALTCGLQPYVQAETLEYWVKGVNKDGGWYDADKDFNGNDNLLCWAASSSNIIAWWQDQNPDLAAQATAANGEKAPLGDDVWSVYRQSYKSTGGYAMHSFYWYFYEWADEDQATWMTNYRTEYGNSVGAYYSSVLGNVEPEILFDSPYYWFDVGEFSRDFCGFLQAGYGVSISVESEYVSHALTLWGVEYDTELDRLTRLWLTDSDDNDQREGRTSYEEGRNDLFSVTINYVEDEDYWIPLMYLQSDDVTADGKRWYDNVEFWRDFTLLNSNVKSVPEPATGSLSLLALAGLCARRRRK